MACNRTAFLQWLSLTANHKECLPLLRPLPHSSTYNNQVSATPGSVNAGCPTWRFLVLSQSHEDPSSWRIGLAIVALSKRSRQPSVGLLPLFGSARMCAVPRRGQHQSRVAAQESI